MRTELSGLSGTRYDLLVVGGGIHGLFAAYDAASRGLSVALVERADFGSGLSLNHQRTIHGGLRDVGAGRLGKARRQVAERRAWAHMAPHLIRPLPFLVGTYRFTTRSRWAIKAGFAAYDLVGRSRNHNVPPELHLPKGKLESAATTRRLFPGVKAQGLSGGAVWYDYQIRHPDRLNWTVVLAARAAGARLVNYAEAIGPLVAGGRVEGARIRDRQSGQEHDVFAGATLLASGGNLSEVMGAFGVRGAPPVLRAMNVLVNRPARDIATAAPGPSGRMLTIVPWRGYALVGTHQSEGTIDGSEAVPPTGAVEAMLAEVNATFPALQIKRQDVRLVHHGLTPATLRDGRAELLPEAQVLRHAEQGVKGVLSLVGVKLTTARRTAEHAVNAVCHELGRAPGRCRTATAALPHAGISDVEGRLVEALRDVGATLDRDVMEHLTGWYATEAPIVLGFGARRGLLDRLAPDTPVLSCEIAYAAEEADAVHLSDAVLRRTALGSAGHPGRPALERAADIMGAVRQWTAQERQQQIVEVEKRYQA